MKTHSLSHYLWLFLWLVVPILIIAGQIGLELSVTDKELLARMHSEGGPQETLQEYFIAGAFLMALYCAVRENWLQKPLIGGALIVAAVGCFYILGEEISWGQHKLGSSTPEFWGAINDQNETNLHNTSSWLDQKPRLLLFIGIVLLGVVVPLVRRYSPARLPARWAAFYPSSVLSVAALGVLLPYTVQEIAEHFFNGRVFVRVSEVQELYMYYFLLIYFIDFRLRKNTNIA